jgi:ATP-dependent exoDNAse (exonuclease V) alpha subunit
LFLFIEKEEDDKEFTNAELVYTALTRAKRNLIVFNLGNPKYDNFFKSEIQNCFEHRIKNAI